MHVPYVKKDKTYACVVALNNLEDCRPGCFSKCTEWELDLWWEKPQGAFKAWCEARDNDTCPLKPSVPPSTNGLIVARSGLPSES